MSENRNILLVDDYEVNQIIGKRHLENAGYSVDVAPDGAEAVSAFESNQYDLILMDIEMPVLDGWECTQKIRRLENVDASCHAGRIPIIAMSGHVLEDDATRYQQAGMDDCMPKPIEREILLAVVEKWLSRQAVAEPAVDACSTAPEKNIRSGLDSTPVDMTRAIEEFMGDRDMLDHLLGEFVRKGNEQITAIEQALSSAGFEKIRQEAHALKGGAANLTAYSLADSCADMETAAETAAGTVTDPISSKFAKLKNEFKRLKLFVSQTRKPEASAG